MKTRLSRKTSKTKMTVGFSALATGLVWAAACGGLDSLDPAALAATDPRAPIALEKTSLTVASNDAAHSHPVRLRCPGNVPAALDPPAEATIAFGFAAQGVQIYTCKAAVATAPAVTPGPTFTLKAPHAVLSDGPQVRAVHFAGPSWQALDGSLITGAKVASSPSPDPAAIPWLLLKAATHSGTGAFADVTFIQRLDTVGGVAPSTGCDDTHLGTEVLVPYRSSYFFYVTAAPGTHVRQCSSSSRGDRPAP